MERLHQGPEVRLRRTPLPRGRPTEFCSLLVTFGVFIGPLSPGASLRLCALTT